MPLAVLAAGGGYERIELHGAVEKRTEYNNYVVVERCATKHHTLRIAILLINYKMTRACLSIVDRQIINFGNCIVNYTS